uniref:Uncharacterized protein n=1 Tax=Cucumis melo TaxID=3656 RepID=A0A9I9EFI6_CUCME
MDPRASFLEHVHSIKTRVCDGSYEEFNPFGTSELPNVLEYINQLGEWGIEAISENDTNLKLRLSNLTK